MRRGREWLGWRTVRSEPVRALLNSAVRGVGTASRTCGAGLVVLTLALGLAPRAGLAQTPAQPTAAPVAAPVPVPVQDFFAKPDMEEPRLSPTGRYLSVLRADKGGRNSLVVLDLQDMGQSKALVGYSEFDIFNVRWVGDDHLIYSLTDRALAAAEFDFGPGLFSIDRTGGTPRELIRQRFSFGIQTVANGIDRRLDADHTLLAVPQDGSGEIILGKMFRGAGDFITLEPLRLHVRSLLTRTIKHGGPGTVNRWLFDAAGEPRLATVLTPGRVKIHWRAPGTEQWQLIQDADRLNVPWTPYAVDAAGTLYVTHSPGTEGLAVLSRFDFASKDVAATATVEVPGFDFDGGLVSERHGGRTLGVRAMTDGEITIWTDPTMKALQEQIDQRLPGRVNRLSCRRCDDKGRVVLVESFSDRDPGQYFLWQDAQQRLQRLGRVLPGINPAQMAPLALQRITARDGRDLPVWITLPQRLPGAPPPPAVVLVHGGPHVRGVIWEWHALPQFLASRGYAVIEPEFRGSEGYGQAHFRAGWKQWGQAMQNDIADSLQWAVTKGYADGARICIMGASYGGYATLMGLVRHPELFRCGIAAMAVTDLTRIVEGSWWWQDDISKEGRRYDLPAMVGDPKSPADAAMLKANSPVLLAQRIQAPVMLVHGEKDERVPLVHALEMRKALRAAGKEPEWLVFDREGHGWYKPENELTYARRVEAFLAKHLLAPAGQAAAQGVPTNK